MEMGNRLETMIRRRMRDGVPERTRGSALQIGGSWKPNIAAVGENPYCHDFDTDAAPTYHPVMGQRENIGAAGKPAGHRAWREI